MSVVKTQSPTSSSGAKRSSESIAASFANSSLEAPASAANSPIDPETSIRISTRARFRTSSHDRWMRSSTSGAGGSSVSLGCWGRSPFSWVINGPGVAS